MTVRNVPSPQPRSPAGLGAHFDTRSFAGHSLPDKTKVISPSLAVCEAAAGADLTAAELRCGAAGAHKAGVRRTAFALHDENSRCGGKQERLRREKRLCQVKSKPYIRRGRDYEGDLFKQDGNTNTNTAQRQCAHSRNIYIRFLSSIAEKQANWRGSSVAGSCYRVKGCLHLRTSTIPTCGAKLQLKSSLPLNFSSIQLLGSNSASVKRSSGGDGIDLRRDLRNSHEQTQKPTQGAALRIPRLGRDLLPSPPLGASDVQTLEGRSGQSLDERSERQTALSGGRRALRTTSGGRLPLIGPLETEKGSPVIVSSARVPIVLQRGGFIN